MRSEQGWETQHGERTLRTASRRVRNRWLRDGLSVVEVWRVGGRLSGEAYAQHDLSRDFDF